MNMMYMVLPKTFIFLNKLMEFTVVTVAVKNNSSWELWYNVDWEQGKKQQEDKEGTCSHAHISSGIAITLHLLNILEKVHIHIIDYDGFVEAAF